MKNLLATTDENKKTRVDLVENTSVGISQVWLGVIIFMAAIIGVWGFICLASGLVEGGISGLVKGWLAALNG